LTPKIKTQELEALDILGTPKMSRAAFVKKTGMPEMNERPSE
jgi:hypothetical protein